MAPQLTVMSGLLARALPAWSGSREELLAGARLAREENGGVGRRDALHLAAGCRAAPFDEPRIGSKLWSDRQLLAQGLGLARGVTDPLLGGESLLDVTQDQREPVAIVGP